MTHQADVACDVGSNHEQPATARPNLRLVPDPAPLPHDAALRDAVEDLFFDADRLGPRAASMLRRVVPAIALLAFALLLAALEPWRAFLMVHAPSMFEPLLVVPVFFAIVACAAAGAPMSRTRTSPTLMLALAFLVGGAVLVSKGQVVAAGVATAPGALLLGYAVARAFRRAVWLCPILIVAALSDMHSVHSGVTRDLLAGTGAGGRAVQLIGQAAAQTSTPVASITRLDYLVLHLPATAGFAIIGIVDIIAIGMVFALAHLNWQPLVRTVIALAIALSLATAASMPIPLLPLIGIAWTIAHTRLVWRATRFSLRRLTYLGG